MSMRRLEMSLCGCVLLPFRLLILVMGAWILSVGCGVGGGVGLVWGAGAKREIWRWTSWCSSGVILFAAGYHRIVYEQGEIRDFLSDYRDLPHPRNPH